MEINMDQLVPDPSKNWSFTINTINMVIIY